MINKRHPTQMISAIRMGLGVWLLNGVEGLHTLTSTLHSAYVDPLPALGPPHTRAAIHDRHRKHTSKYSLCEAVTFKNDEGIGDDHSKSCGAVPAAARAKSQCRSRRDTRGSGRSSACASRAEPPRFPTVCWVGLLISAVL